MLQWVGGQRQNPGPHMARRAGTGKEDLGVEGLPPPLTPGTSSAWEKWGPQGGREDGAEDHAGVPCDSWIPVFVLSTPRCPFLLLLLQ